jgi:hypothetical protein
MKTTISVLLLTLMAACGGGDPAEEEPVPSDPCSVEYIDRFGLDENWRTSCVVHPPGD